MYVYITISVIDRLDWVPSVRPELRQQPLSMTFYSVPIAVQPVSDKAWVDKQ